MIMASYKMKEDLFRHITAKEFISLDVDKYTIVDLREPDEVITGRIGGSINIPFSVFYSELDRISKEKPVIVYCRTGEWSEEIADILNANDLAERYKTYDRIDEEQAFQRIKSLLFKEKESKELNRTTKYWTHYRRLLRVAAVILFIITGAGYWWYHDYTKVTHLLIMRKIMRH